MIVISQCKKKFNKKKLTFVCILKKTINFVSLTFFNKPVIQTRIPIKLI